MSELSSDEPQAAAGDPDAKQHPAWPAFLDQMSRCVVDPGLRGQAWALFRDGWDARVAVAGATTATRILVTCTCGERRLVEAGSVLPTSCPACGAPERYPTRSTDYVRPPWEELDARRMHGVFHAEGETPDPLALFRTQDAAARWLTWQTSLGDDGEVGGGDYTLAVVDQIDGIAWNSHEAPPPPDVGE